MAYSAATYKGDGSQSTFIIPFDYLQKDFVKVTINEVDKVYAQDYNVDGRELSFPTAPPSGSIIKVYRETPTDRMVKWNEGSVLTSSNMTTQQIQELHLIEETTYNLNNSAMVKTEDGHKWEGQYLPITHVGNPTDDSDAVNLGTIKKEETGFLASVRSQLDKWLADLGTTYNSYSKSLKESFDSYTSSLSTTFNGYKDTLLSKYNEYLASLTATKDAVKDSESNALTYKDEAKSFSDSAKTSEVNAKASEVAAAESAKQAAAGQINADWNETNVDSMAFIKNKPDVPTKADVQGELTNYLPLSGGTLTGAINTANKTWNKLGDDASFGDYNIGGKMCIKSQTARKTGIAFFNETDTNVGEVEVNNAFDFNKPVKENGGFLVPIGIVQAFAGRTTPQGWLLCDGSAVSRTDYAALFAVIGTTYGAGNGSTTFNLPNLTDKFIQGSATSGTVKSAGLPNITGLISIGFNGIGGGVRPDGSGAFNNQGNLDSYESTNTGVKTDTSSWNLSMDASRSSSIYGNSTTVQPPALTMRYIIKY